MAKANLKTKVTDKNVEIFLNEIEDQKRRDDCFSILTLMRDTTGEEPKMWGNQMIGFGSYHYKYESGREGDWFITGFSPRKQNITIYIMSGFDDYPALMNKLGKYKTGKSCLYIKKIEDVDVTVLQNLIKKSVEYISQKYG